MLELAKVNEAISRFLRPATFPLAARLVRHGEQIPARVKRPFKDFGEKVAICQVIAMARHYGWAIFMGPEDASCPIQRTAFGHEPMTSYYAEGHLCANMYTATTEMGSRSEEAVAKLPHGEIDGTLVAPIDRASFEPEVFVIYGNSAQVMVLVAAWLYNRGGELTSSFSARADCSDIIIRTIQKDAPQVILPCNGDRVFGQTEDWEMAFTAPARCIDEIVDGLAKCHQGGIRYPIPKWLRYTPKFPEHYEKLNEIWAQPEAKDPSSKP